MSASLSHSIPLIMSSWPCNPDWPDDLHWETISYLTPSESTALSEPAIKYILTITKATNRSVESFLSTYNGSEQFRSALRNWQFSKIEQLIDDSKQEYVDSEEEEETLQSAQISSATFLDLSPQQFAIKMQKLVRSGNWKTVATMMASGKQIPANTYCILIEEAATQGMKDQFQLLLKKRPLINYDKLISIFHRYKVSFGAYEIIQTTHHYTKMNVSQREKLDKLHQGKKC